MQNLLSLITLVALAQRTRSNWDFVPIQNKFAPIPLLENNFTETQTTTVMTTAITVDDEKFDDYELKKLFVKNFKLYTRSEQEGHKAEPPHTSPRRKARAVGNITGPFYGMECLLCYANGTTERDVRCYQGVKIPTKRCSDAEVCFTEIHPLYLKRGCILPGRNRTFVCNCPLCNDKPAKETIHYEYTKLSDWAYDNIRLTKPVIGVQLPCKVCVTKGSDVILDNNCRTGKNTNYMVCEVNQICYTNIDDETDFVSRGCINSIVFNSMFYFCSSSICNNVKFLNPKLLLSQEEIHIKGKPSYLKRALNLDDLKKLTSGTSPPLLFRNNVILSKLILILCFII